MRVEMIPVVADIESVRPLDMYVFQCDVYCRDGSILSKGSRLTVILPTHEVPYGEIGPRGVNWICDAENGRTIWATLEQCISRGLLKLECRGA